MAKVGAQRAAELTGRSKSTIQRSMNSGKLSYELDANGRRVIDVSELERVFGLKPSTVNTIDSTAVVQQELEKASSMLEVERLKMRIKMLEDQLETANTMIEDLKIQRDQWQKQASQMLITSEHSQKQAQALQQELKEREQRARQIKQKRLEQQMKKMQAENENSTQKSQNSKFSDLWERVKKYAS